MNKQTFIAIVTAATVVALGPALIAAAQVTSERKPIPREQLVITQLLSKHGTVITDEAGTSWSITQYYDNTAVYFTVLPAGRPPYRWSVDDPSLVALRKRSPLGFSVGLVPKQEGSTTLRVKDASGLMGELVIEANKLEPPSPPSPPSPPIRPPDLPTPAR